MSVSLVKISLDLVSTESHPSKETPVEFQRGRKRRPKFKKKVSDDPKKNAAVLVQKLRENSKKASTNQNKIETNVQKLLKLSNNNIAHTNKEKKLLRKISKSKRRCPKSEKKKETPTFTEEDFAKFEKEFFAN